jgi:hypothetical protein
VRLKREHRSTTVSVDVRDVSEFIRDARSGRVV